MLVTEMIDREIKRIIDEATTRTMKILEEKKELVKSLSDRLLEKETLDLKDIIAVLGERPFKPKSSFKAFLEETRRDLVEELEKKEPLPTKL